MESSESSSVILQQAQLPHVEFTPSFLSSTTLFKEVESGISVSSGYDQL